MKITITEFVRPNGEQVPRVVYIEDIYRDKFNELTQAGCRLTLEKTSNGDFFICIEDTIYEDDFVTDIFHNFSLNTVIEGLSTIVGNYNACEHVEWRMLMEKINGGAPPF